MTKKQKKTIKVRITKRFWIFRYLREKIGLNALGLEFYHLKDRVIDLEKKVNELQSLIKKNNYDQKTKENRRRC